MAKEAINLCPEKNEYVNGDQRKISDKLQESVNFERTPLLDPELRWIAPKQENCGIKMKIRGEERISKRHWYAGFNAEGEVVSVRSIAVPTLRAMALGFVKDGVAAPEVASSLNEDGNVRTAPGTQYVHAMEDTSFIGGERNLYIVKTPVALKPQGSAEVYQPEFKDNKMVSVNGKVVLTRTTMKFFTRLSDPTKEEVQKATEAIRSAVGDQFYAL